MIKSNNLHGKRFSDLTKDVFSNPNLSQNPFKLSSTGLNVSKHNFVDTSLIGSNHKYGKTTIRNPHPCLDVIIPIHKIYSLE